MVLPAHVDVGVFADADALTLDVDSGVEGAVGLER